MSVLTLYLLLLKATLVSFAGLASLPVVHNDLVVQRRILTDRQLSTAVAVGRAGPGPVGLYLVCVGYYAAGIPGAVTACIAVMTPAFLVIPLLRYLGRRAEDERVKRTIRAIVLGSAGVLLSSAVPLARDALHGPTEVVIALASLLVLALTKVDTLWVVAVAALAGLAGRMLGMS